MPLVRRVDRFVRHRVAMYRCRVLADLDHDGAHPDGQTWKARVQRAFPSTKVRLKGPSPGTWTYRSARVGELSIHEVEAGPQHVSHPAEPRFAPLVSAIAQVEGSCRIHQRSGPVELRAGQVVLVDVDQPLELEASALYRQVFVLVPRVLLGPIPRSAHGKPTEPESPTDRFVVDHIQHLASTPSPSDARQARLMTQALLAHLRLLTPVHDALRSGGASRIERALDFIELHLGDPSLSAEAVAAAQGVGRRHLDALFRRRGLTVSQTIWRRRLDRAALRLRSAAWKDETVLAIGLESGFSSASHFARAFREAFGQTPSAFRASRSTFA